MRHGYNSRARGRAGVRPSDLYFIKTAWRMDLGIRVGQGDQRGGDSRAGDGEDQLGWPRSAVRRGGFGWFGRQGGDQ